MAALDEMRVKIGADLSGLVKGAADASKILSEVGASATKIIPAFTGSAAAADALEASLDKLASTGTAKINAIADAALKSIFPMNNLSKSVAAFGGGVTNRQVPDYFVKIREEASKAGAALGSQVKPGSDKAAFALQNLGRIAQDAPFGIIGITNNINPMLESFQRLQKETGSTSGALKAMAASLTGAGGLGLAVSVATSILTVLALNGFFKTEKAADDAKKKIDAFKDAVSNIFGDAAKEATTVQGLIAVLESETASRKRKADAIKELQRINPETFSGLKIEGDLVSGLDAAYKSYIENIKTVIAVKIKQQQLEDVTKKILEKEGTTLTTTAKILHDIVKSEQDSAIARTRDANSPALAKRIKDTTELNGLYGEQSKLFNDIKELQSGVKVDPVKDTKAKAHIKDVDDVLKQLNEDLLLNQRLGDIGFISSSEQDAATIQKTRAAIEEILKLKNGPGANSPIITKLITSINPEEARTQLTERLKEIVKTVRPEDLRSTDLPEVKIPANIHITANLKAAMANLNKEFIDEFNKSAQEIQKGIMNSAFADLGDTIGAAIGGGDVTGAFRGLLNTVIEGMKQLGEAMIGLGTAKIALEKFNLAPGIGTVIAGVGVIALSSLIQSALPKFANGVTGFGGGFALVGERGPEVVRLPQGSDVIPNHRLDQVTGGGVQVFIPSFTLRGSDIRVAFNRASAQASRQG
jgi:hypothetical protein